MKKLSILVVLLFLAGCSDNMTGVTQTTCVDLEMSLVRPGVGETVITIDGDGEDIMFWRVATTLTRAEFDTEFLQGLYLSDDEIHDLFTQYSPSTMQGVIVYVSELNDDYITITQVFDYAGMSLEDLNNLWNVDDFESDVTLSAAIEGLEENGAYCTIIEIEDTED